MGSNLLCKTEVENVWEVWGNEERGWGVIYYVRRR